MCLNITKSQPGGSKRTCDREPLFHTGIGGHLSGVISLFLRMLRYQENTKFKKKKNYNTRWVEEPVSSLLKWEVTDKQGRIPV